MANLESKVESLTATHALMKEDLSICRTALGKSRDENRRLVMQLQRSASASDLVSAGKKVITGESNNASDVEEERNALKKELGLQVENFNIFVP